MGWVAWAALVNPGSGRAALHELLQLRLLRVELGRDRAVRRLAPVEQAVVDAREALQRLGREWTCPVCVRGLHLSETAHGHWPNTAKDVWGDELRRPDCRRPRGAISARRGLEDRFLLPIV